LRIIQAVKRRHHYVPQFYLKAFASAPKRINVFNLKRGRTIQDASLRDQCYSHRLYGESDEIEDAFAEVEGRAAPVIQKVASTQRPPEMGTTDYQNLLLFVTLQILRTTAARNRVQRSSIAFARRVFDDAPPPAGFVPDEAQSMALSLSPLRHVSDGLEGLKVHAITAPSGSAFITCDNPAYRYNQYCEGVRWQGLTGALCRGLQVFLPLSPLVSVLLFDGGVYKVGRRGVAPSSQATERDVEFLNTIQLLAAADNVYFGGWGSAPVIQRLTDSVREERNKNRVRIMEAYEVGNERSSLIHQYEQMPDLNLQLSFVGLRRDARRVPLEARVRLLRKRPPPELDAPALDPEYSRSRIFETRVRR
jgi:hypothetical protein